MTIKERGQIYFLHSLEPYGKMLSCPLFFRLWVVSAEQKGGVLASESKAIVDGFSDFSADGLLRDIKKIAAVIGVFQVDGGVNPAVFDHQRRGDGFDTP